MRIIMLSLAALVFLFIPSCRSSHVGSVVSVECRNAPLAYYIDDSLKIRLINSVCPGYSFKEERLLDYLEYFVIGYSSEFEIDEYKVWDLISNLKIETSAIPKKMPNVYDMKGKFLKSSPVAGLALSPNWIWIEIKTKFICHTALAHELVHIIIWRTQKVHADPDHEGTEFSGWTKKHTRLIKRINSQLCELGI